MISRLGVRNFRCLREVDQPLRRFNVLVGANGSGKSTFLDALLFLSDIVRDGVTSAIAARTDEYRSLFGLCNDNASIDIDVDLQLRDNTAITYGLEVLNREDVYVPEIGDERLNFIGDLARPQPVHVRGLFSVHSDRSALQRNYYGEDKLVLLGSDVVSMVQSVRKIDLRHDGLCRESNEHSERMGDGSALSSWVRDLRQNHLERYEQWLAHVQTVLPIGEVTADPRLMVDRRPACAVSEGTLRLLALTILPYLPDFTGTYLIEEPENGIHPQAIEAVVQSLTSVWDGQVLIATHSPLFLSLCEPQDVLCFTRTDDEGTKIINGAQHPRLRDWRREVSLGTLFAGGVFNET